MPTKAPLHSSTTSESEVVASAAVHDRPHYTDATVSARAVDLRSDTGHEASLPMLARWRRGGGRRLDGDDPTVTACRTVAAEITATKGRPSIYVPTGTMATRSGCDCTPRPEGISSVREAAAHVATTEVNEGSAGPLGIGGEVETMGGAT